MRRPAIFMGLALVTAFLAAMVVFSALRKRDAEMKSAIAKTANIVVAARDVGLGTRLSPSDLKLARWSADSIPAGSFSDAQSLVDQYTGADFVAGEPIIARKVLSAEKAGGVMPLLIPSGMRAMSVAVDEISDIAGFVKPHSRVDILAAVSSEGGAESKPFAKIVLQNVEVLAVAQEIERVKDEPEVVKVVTLLVTPHQAEKLGLASREGTLRLVMRNFSDTKSVATVGSDLAELLERGAAAPTIRAQDIVSPVKAEPVAKPFTIEITRDGKPSEDISFAPGGATPIRGEKSGGVAASKAQTPEAVGAPKLPPPPPDTPSSRSAASAGRTNDAAAAVAHAKTTGDAAAPDGLSPSSADAAGPMRAAFAPRIQTESTHQVKTIDISAEAAR